MVHPRPRRLDFEYDAYKSNGWPHFWAAGACLLIALAIVVVRSLPMITTPGVLSRISAILVCR